MKSAISLDAMVDEALLNPIVRRNRSALLADGIVPSLSTNWKLQAVGLCRRLDRCAPFDRILVGSATINTRGLKPLHA